MKRHRWIVRYLLPLLVFVGAVVWLTANFSLRHEISRATTFVIGPVMPNGKVDFVAAIHEKLSQGVTSENNAAVLIVRAMGPKGILLESRADYFQRLSIDPLPEEGEYVIGQEELIERESAKSSNPAKQKQEFFDQFTRSTLGTWTRTDCPLVAEWLDLNAKPLQLIEQAASRECYYSPPIPEDNLIDSFSSAARLRESIRLLIARARWRLGEGDAPGAWSDLQAGHRLARLASQRSVSSSGFQVALGVDSAISRCDETLVSHGLSADQARRSLQDHLQLPDFGAIQHVVNFQERLQTLYGFCYLEGTILDLVMNRALRQTNLVFDDLVLALKQSDHAARMKSLAAIEATLKKNTTQASQPLQMVFQPGDAMVGTLLQLGLPQLSSTLHGVTRTQCRADLTRIGFALAAFRAERHTYPHALEELVPDYLSSIPVDRFSNQPLKYAPHEHGFLIHSVGLNGIDEGGRAAPSTKEDDIAFRLPQQVDEN